jgi:hypothetical protein
MKLRYSSDIPGVKPTFVPLSEHDKIARDLGKIYLRIEALKLEIRRQRSEGKEADPNLYEELKFSRQQRKELEQNIPPGSPHVLVSRCPYCDTEVWMYVGISSLMEQYWHLESGDGREHVAKDCRCPHLFCVDGALNLNGNQPTGKYEPIEKGTEHDRISMAAEVPFVKPRVLNLPTMVAVIHSLPVEEKYTAYPIVYFAEKQPPQIEFCMPWARREYFASTNSVGPSGWQIVMMGKRRDAQVYELEDWIRQRKLFWLDPKNKEHPLVRGSVEAFPYYNVTGRRHPYIIKDGEVQNLENPTKDSESEIRREY